MKVIIAGTRTFSDYHTLQKECDSFLSEEKDIEVVSGTATGADQLGEKYAQEKGYNLKRFPADWKKYHRFAGPIRNGQMAKYADALIAFWNGESRGTKDMIKQAQENGLKIRVVNYSQLDKPEKTDII